tara:strand:+ start:695 stop:874 length:180 start_codon:yes stop_codon:yes gene_type:complete
MNQIREWEGFCQSCFSATVEYTMSMYDVTLICLKCAENEKKYPEKNPKTKLKKEQISSS